MRYVLAGEEQVIEMTPEPESVPVSSSALRVRASTDAGELDADVAVANR